jgi:uncharacterized protein YdhG (YjbR/CyaY superfamily)
MKTPTPKKRISSSSGQQRSDLPKLAQPAQRALTAAGVQRLEQLTRFSEDEVKQWHGIGPNALNQLRRALAERGLEFGIEKRKIRTKKSRPLDDAQIVDEFMDQLDHPFKSEVQMIREIIKSVNKDIAEEIKWNAPSFSYNGEYLVTFNLWEKKRVHLVFHNAEISKVRSNLLVGDYEHRRMAYFVDKDDIKAKKAALEKTLKDLIRLQKKQKETV